MLQNAVGCQSEVGSFSDYQQADLAIHAGQLVIFGDNGAGKTNLLEAVSLLSPGQGCVVQGARVLLIPLSSTMDCRKIWAS